MSYAKGIMWLDDCRIPFVDEKDPSAERYKSYRNVENLYGGYGDTYNDYKEQQGRFTPNLLVCDDMLNDGVIRQGNKPSKRNKNHRYSMDYGLKVYEGMDITGYGDIGSSSRYYDLDLWFDKMLEGL